MFIDTSNKMLEICLLCVLVYLTMCFTAAVGGPLLEYRSKEALTQNVRVSLSVPLTEQHWQAASGAFVDQRTFLRKLNGFFQTFGFKKCRYM